MSDDLKRNSAFNAPANIKVQHAQLQDLSKTLKRRLHKGGIRSGEPIRTKVQAQEMLEKIPPSQRVGMDGKSAVSNAENYLSDKHASHIEPHSKGGSNNPNNIKWENAKDNITRGNKTMTWQEQMRLNAKWQFDNLTGAVKAGFQAAPLGAAVGAAVTAPFSLLTNALRVVRGEISAQEATTATLKDTVIGGLVGGATAFTTTTVAAACPPIAIALTTAAPVLAVVGAAGMVYEFFKILDDHKQTVRIYYESLNELKEELIIVPDDYNARLLTAIAATKTINSVLSVDLGRNYTKTCVSREPSNVMFIPANVKQISFEEIRNHVFESIATDPLMDLWIKHQGSGYFVGQLAANFGASLGVGQSKLEDALVKVLACAGYFKLKDEISVVINLPFFCSKQFEIEKEYLISMIAGPHVMNFRGESVYLNISKVWVMPEGYGSLLWCEAQPKKGPGVPDFSKVAVAIVDIGHQTVNCLMVDNFRFAREFSESEDFAMSQFYEIVASNIEVERRPDSQSLALISAVNKPKGDRFYRPKPTNLDDFLPNLTEMFSRQICDRVLAWLPERVTDVIITGGGGEFFWEDMQRLLKEAKINAHLAAPSRQANALGQYIYGEAQYSKSNRI